MATKRSATHVYPSRQVPVDPRCRRQKANNPGPQSFKKAHPVNELKSQVRSLKRLLARNEGLPADVRIEKERALTSARHELAVAERAKQRSEMIGKYHKIRFFDRQKATKRLKRARKELQGCEQDSERRAELQRQVEDCEVDVNYAQYYPLDTDYVSLFPRMKDDQGARGDENHKVRQDDKQDSAVERKGDQDMWREVRECMASGKLDALRNGKHVRGRNRRLEALSQSDSRPKQARLSTDDTLIKSLEKDVNNGDDGNESDGSFFEHG